MDGLDATRALAAGFADGARAPSTDLAYARDWRAFVSWCGPYGLATLPALPETVALYLAHGAQSLRTATLQRRLAALVVTHRRAGHRLDTDNPALAEVWRGIRRALGTAKTGKAALTPGELTGMLAAQPDTLAGRRDRALLLLVSIGVEH